MTARCRAGAFPFRWPPRPRARRAAKRRGFCTDRVMPHNPRSRRFHAILKELGRTHDRKQADYGRPEDPFANVRASEEWGIPAWAGAMLRASDKIRRLQALLRNGRLENESARDSFIDLAVYAVIGLVLYEEARHDQPTPSPSRRTRPAPRHRA